MTERDEIIRNDIDEDGDGKPMSGFGYYVHKLMSSRRITRQKQLAQRLKKRADFDVRPQNLSNWFHGTQPPTEYLQALIIALSLTEQEKAELYRKYVEESRLES